MSTGIEIVSADSQNHCAGRRGFRQRDIVFVVAEFWWWIIGIVNADTDGHFWMRARYAVGSADEQFVFGSGFVIQPVDDIDETCDRQNKMFTLSIGVHIITSGY